jgi:hypothetical protein
MGLYQLVAKSQYFPFFKTNNDGYFPLIKENMAHKTNPGDCCISGRAYQRYETGFTA